MPVIWQRSHRFDRRALLLADQHYSRQKPGTDQFVKAGSCAVFYAEHETSKALWVTAWQLYAKHRWHGAWECALFRNEGFPKASRLIREAISATRAHYGEPPELGMITFVDPKRIRPKEDPGHCFIIAGFRPCGETPEGLLVFRLDPSKMPPPRPLAWSAPSFLEAAA
jgi:hypothetical protein